jgi:hypothetical protein
MTPSLMIRVVQLSPNVITPRDCGNHESDPFIASLLVQQDFACVHLHYRNPSCQPSTRQDRNFVFAVQYWSSPILVRHSSACLRTPASSLDPLRIMLATRELLNGIFLVLLFSINFGMPKIRPIDTRAMRIIGFFKKDKGETKCVSKPMHGIPQRLRTYSLAFPDRSTWRPPASPQSPNHFPPRPDSLPCCPIRYPERSAMP